MAFEKLLPIARELAFAKGAWLVRQGEPSRGAFLIRGGTVEAQVALPGGGMLTVAELGPGEMFGEMALIERGACSASVRAKGEVSAWFIERDDFRAMVASRDSAALAVQREVTGVLAQKLRALNAKVRAHPAEEDRAPHAGPPAHIDLAAAAAPLFDWRAFLPLLRFFEGFAPHEIEELVSIGRALQLPRTKWLFAAGSTPASAFLVIRGAVEVLAREGKLERRVALAGPGELVGYLAVLEDVPHTASARVRESAALVELPAERLRALYEGSSGTSVRLQHAIHESLLRALTRTNGQLGRLIAAARLRGAKAESRALEAARGSQIVDLVEQSH